MAFAYVSSTVVSHHFNNFHLDKKKMIHRKTFAYFSGRFELNEKIRSWQRMIKCKQKWRLFSKEKMLNQRNIASGTNLILILQYLNDLILFQIIAKQTEQWSSNCEHFTIYFCLKGLKGSYVIIMRNQYRHEMSQSCIVS